MPYKNIKEARDSIPSLKSLSDKQVDVFISVFNNLLEQGDKESEAIPKAISAAKKIKKSLQDLEKASAKDVTKLPNGNIEYLGKEYPGFNKPIKSDREGKTGMVLAKKGDDIKVVHFGDNSFEVNYSTEANDNFYSRFGNQEGLTDKFSPLYWSASWLWPKGNMKGKGPKEFYTLNKSKEVIKASDLNKEEQISIEIVYLPNEKDAHNEWMSKDTIYKAYLSFMENLQKGVVQPNLYHFENTDLISIEDTWIQKFDCKVIDSKGNVQDVPEGTWICKLKWHCPHLWQMRKMGIIGGVSIGGRGKVDKDTGEITEVSFDPYEDTSN